MNEPRCKASQEGVGLNPMRIQFRASDLTPHGLEIGILGFKDSPANRKQWPAQIFIEYHEAKVRVHVWNGGEDPVASVEIEPASL